MGDSFKKTNCGMYRTVPTSGLYRKTYYSVSSWNEAEDHDGEGVKEILSAIGSAASSAKKTLAPVVKDAYGYLKKNPKMWADPLISGASHLGAAGMRALAEKISKREEQKLADIDEEKELQEIYEKIMSKKKNTMQL